MRRPAVTAITLLAATILATLTALNVSSAQNLHRSSAQTGPTPPPPPFSGTPVIGTPPTTGGPSFEKLTNKQKTQILKLVKSDKTVKKLLGKKTYRVTTMWVWATTKGAFLGGVVTIQLSKPATVSGKWFDLAYDCTEQKSPPYGRVPYTAKYTSVTSLTIYVDLKRKRVAGIRPLGVIVGAPRYPAKYKIPTKSAC